MSNVRLERLESRLRWTERGLVACVAGIILFVGLGMVQSDDARKSADVQQELRLKRLVIVDDDGKDMIILQSSGEEEGPSMQINDEQGTKRFWLGTKEEGESRFEHWDFETSDRDSVLRIVSFIDNEGLCLTQFDDDLGRRRIGIGTSSEDGEAQSGFITCVDKEDRGRIWMGTSEDGMSELVHTDANGARRIFDFTDGDTSSDASEDEDTSDFLAGRWYVNPYQTSRMWLGSERGSVSISQYDWNAKIRMVFSTMFSGASRMGLWDDEGEMVWGQKSEGKEPEMQ